MRLEYVTSAALLSATVLIGAQTPDPPTFEVASVKRRTEPLYVLPGPQGLRPGGSFAILNAPLARLLMYAVDLPDERLIGGPAWIRVDRFDVEARAGREPSVAESRLMLRALLQERFKLVAHRERREMPAYTLVVDRPDGRLGPALRSGCPQEAVPRPAQVPQGAMTSTGCGAIAVLARGASTLMRAPVVDKTGLTGTFHWSMYAAPPAGSIFDPAAGPPADLNLPAYPTALREQLGLRLEASREVVDVIVIDSAQQPTGN